MRQVITVRGLYELLLNRLGPTHWWPAETRFEIAVGAILTQNTAWGNVSIALDRLKAANVLNPQSILNMEADELGELIRSTGYWRMKTGYLKAFCAWLVAVAARHGKEYVDIRDDDGLRRLVDDRSDAELRNELLGLRGIGGETADDLLLYVFDRPAFIADRYARRLFTTLGVNDLAQSYEGFRARVQPCIEEWGIDELKEFHGLIDELGKTMHGANDWSASFVAEYWLTFDRLEHVEHGFGPVWDASSRVLVLGSMPSPKSREMRFYYGHPRNRFWKTMSVVFDDDTCLPILSTSASAKSAEKDEELVRRRRKFALRHHVALWDVIASCDIEGASDASIRNAKANDLTSIITRSHISHVFVTGGKAAQLYRRLCVPQLASSGLTDLPMTQLPSTSPANAAVGLDQLIEKYRVIRRAAESE